jgi:hypothetical protein
MAGFGESKKVLFYQQNKQQRNCENIEDSLGHFASS